MVAHSLCVQHLQPLGDHTGCLVKGNLFSSDCSHSQKDWQRFAKLFMADRCVINRLHEIAKLILLSHKLIADFLEINFVLAILLTC